MQRALNELVAALRRAGIAVSTVESIDALRAAQCVGLSEREDFKRVLGATLVKSERDAARFARVFEAFFEVLAIIRAGPLIWSRCSTPRSCGHTSRQQAPRGAAHSGSGPLARRLLDQDLPQDRL